jgi:hypothetical protein
LSSRAAYFTCTARGLTISFRGSHDRTLHQDVPLPGEAVFVGDTGCGGKLFEETPYTRELPYAVLLNASRWISSLQYHVDDRATFKRFRLKPDIERIKDRQQSFCGISRAFFNLLLQATLLSTFPRACGENASTRSSFDRK